MIRCIPVDGGEAFEVENDHMCGAVDAAKHSRRGWSGDVDRAENVVGSSAFVNDIECRIESWRERAERIEHENVLLRLARDYNAVPWPPGYIEAAEPDDDEVDRLEAERDAIEAKIIALGHSLAEAQNL